MKNLVEKTKIAFNDLKPTEKIAVVTVLTIFAGIFFFSSGVSVGEALFELTH